MNKCNGSFIKILYRRLFVMFSSLYENVYIQKLKVKYLYWYWIGLVEF